MLLSINCILHISMLSSLYPKVVTNHILHHLPEGIEKFGPVHGTWMFAYERFNSWLCRRALSRKHPEATILRTYQVMLPVSCEDNCSRCKSIHRHCLSLTSVCLRAIYTFLAKYFVCEGWQNNVYYVNMLCQFHTQP